MLHVTEYASRRDDEIYFSLPPQVPDSESWVEVVEPGDPACRPPGTDSCIVRRPTPVSCGNERRAGEVEVSGRIPEDTSVLKRCFFRPDEYRLPGLKRYSPRPGTTGW